MEEEFPYPVKRTKVAPWNDKLFKVDDLSKKLDDEKKAILRRFVMKTMFLLVADDFQTLTWYIDSAFAVHADMKSHTGSAFTLGKGAICSDSTKQKINTQSSTESELVGVDDKIAKVIWTKKFIECQGFKVKLNIVYQDNQSTLKLSNNGKESSGKRTRHFDIKYFYVTDLISRDEVKVIYCPADDMVADYMSKPLVGYKFKKFRDFIMNLKG
mmetsp:Transcript_34996/g.52860  ORF Transcript_34996/g.52860 Transcript_34996/m.52860 type:complete len:213 (+) Transcript_34996:3-641(+)